MEKVTLTGLAITEHSISSCEANDTEVITDIEVDRSPACGRAAPCYFFLWISIGLGERMLPRINCFFIIPEAADESRFRFLFVSRAR